MQFFSEKDKKELLLFAEECLHIRNLFMLDATVLTPINFSEEKEKFMQSKTYNPQFKYKKIPQKSITKDIQKLQKHLQTLDLPKDLATYLLDYLVHVEHISQTVTAIGTESFPFLSNNIFKSYILDTQKFLQTLPKIDFYEEKKNTMHNAEEIAALFQKSLQTYDALQNWEIHIDNFNDHIIRVQEKKLAIGSQVKRTTENVNRLIVHEIESHILQQYNMNFGNNPLVRLLRFDEATLFSEGLAVFNEVFTKTITRKAYNTYHYRLQAVAMLNSSFREIYNYLIELVTPHQAFIITARVKRGMADTTQPGGFPKDAAYLLGYNKINEYVKSGGTIDSLYIVRHPEYGKLLAKYNLVSTNQSIVLPTFLKKV